MIKNKIIALMTCGALITAGIAGGALISNKSSNTNEKTIQNHILLSAPDLNDLAVVINTNVNPLVLYSSPSSNSSIESYISVGEMLNYTATSNPNFYKVTVQETGATGYISASNMQIIQSGLNKAYENVNKNGQVINVTYDVKLMSTPDVHSQILGSYKNNTQMTVLGKQDQWYKVEIGSQTGYMYQSYVGIDNSISNIVSKTNKQVKNTNSITPLNTSVYTKANVETPLYAQVEVNAPIEQMLAGKGMVLKMDVSEKITLPNGTIYYKVTTSNGEHGYVKANDVVNNFNIAQSTTTQPNITQKNINKSSNSTSNIKYGTIIKTCYLSGEPIKNITPEIINSHTHNIIQISVGTKVQILPTKINVQKEGLTLITTNNGATMGYVPTNCLN